MFDHLNADVFAGVVLILMRQFSEDKHVRDGNSLGLTGMHNVFHRDPNVFCSLFDSSSGFVWK